METFGCCSHFVECSDAGSCLFTKDENYQGCSYNKNLLNGKIFYGERKGQVVSVAAAVIEKVEMLSKNLVSKPEKIFIDCYNRNFKVNRLGGNGCSYPLTADEFQLVIAAFENKVPFCHEVIGEKCIMEGDAKEPANSRVIFTIEGCKQEFVIANFNACLILKRYADGISRALIAKGIKAKVDMMGTYAKVI